MNTVEMSGNAALASRAVQLRPMLPSDSAWCYVLMCGPAGERWRYRGRTPSPEVVEADLWRGVFAQFVVTERLTGRAVGLVGFYNVAAEAGRAHAFAVGEPDAAPLVTEGFGLLCAWGFDHLSWQRIFLEVPEFNAENFASLGDAATVEGRLRNYEVWKGRFWDLLIVSITPESFQKRLGGLLDARRAPVPANEAVDPTPLAELIHEVWPLDSLGAVEVLTAAEELCGAPLDASILLAIDASSPAAFATQLTRRAYEVSGLMPAAVP